MEKDWQELEEYCVQFAENRIHRHCLIGLLFLSFVKLTGYEVTMRGIYRSNPTKEWE